MTQYTENTQRVETILNKMDLLVAPHGAVLNEGSRFTIHQVNTLADLSTVLAVSANKDVPPIVIVQNYELLNLIIKYQDLVPCNPGVLEGMTRGDYDGVFSSTVFPLEKVSYQTVETLLAGKPEISRDGEIIAKREETRRTKELGNEDQSNVPKTSRDFGPSAGAEEGLEDE